MIHERSYWTEYLAPLMEDPDHFQMVRSKASEEKKYLDLPLEDFDPHKHRTILTAGHFYDESDKNLILCRYIHSPGFSIHPMIEGYFRIIANHPSSDFRFIMLKEHYKLLVMCSQLPERHDYIREKMLQDPRVSVSEVDSALIKIKELPIVHERRARTALISPSWLIANEGIEVLKEVHRVLNKGLQLTIVLHPLTIKMTGKIHFVEQVKSLFGADNVHFNIPRRSLVSLYDQHEYIVTDGSGTCYEAMVRGCKPLMINDLSYQKEKGEFALALSEGLLPFPNYASFRQNEFSENIDFLQTRFPYLNKYTEMEANQLIKSEILALI